MHEWGERRTVPAKLYRTPDPVAVAVPLPGLYPEDITVEVTLNNHLVLDAPSRGKLKPDVIDMWPTRPEDPHGTSGGPTAEHPSAEQREVLLDEWDAGGYHRQLDLPSAVDGELATVTYGNGVLVVALPIARQTKAARLTLEAVGPGYGQRVGSTGHPIRPLSTDEHRAVQSRLQAEHGEPATD